MAFPYLSDILATTIDYRAKQVTSNVIKNNALLVYIDQRGGVKEIADGGAEILEPLSFAENSNTAWYSGMDTLSVGAVDVISAAHFPWKQLATAVVLPGLDQLRNSGKEAIIDLMASRIQVAEDTMRNFVAEGIYSDGTGYGGRQLTGLDLAVPINPATGTYGGIDRVSNTFWRSALQSDSGAPSATTIQARMTSLYSKLQCGTESPDLILASTSYYAAFVNSLQAIQRFTSTDKADLGFKSVAFLGADVVLDGGIGGFLSDTNGTMFFLNTKHFKLRPHKDRQFVSLDPAKRWAVNQDAVVQIMVWAGNATSGGPRYCGRMIHT